MTGIYDEPKVDCHNHVFDPARFPYVADAMYRPAGQEIGTAAQLMRVLDAYGVRYALIVGPTSGYAEDSRCLLDAIARSNGRCKGVAVVPLDAGRADLGKLRAAGIVGIAVIPAMHGVAYYAGAADLFRRAADLDLFVQVQTEHDQLVALAPMLERSGARILDRPLRASHPGGGARSARVPHAARPRARRAGVRRALRPDAVLARGLSFCGHAALRPCPDRGVHAGALHVGIGLAVPAGDRARRLRTRS